MGRSTIYIRKSNQEHWDKKNRYYNEKSEWVNKKLEEERLKVDQEEIKEAESYDRPIGPVF